MHRMISLLAALLAASSVALAQDAARPADPATGRPLNLDFEAGDLRDWKVEGEAFAGQPIEGDVVARRRSDMKSRHEGKFWIAGYEKTQDPAVGRLTSKAFKVTQPYAGFLIGAGWYPETRVEIVREADGEVLFKASGEEMSPNEGAEDMRRVAVDLTKEVGKNIFVRVVDEHRGHWGHINFDDFRFYETKPNFPTRPKPAAPDKYAHSGLSPEDAAKAMTVPPGFKVTLFAGEPDVMQPIAFAIDDRGRLWVAEAYTYPHRAPEGKGRDRILIFEDKDGDGKFDERKIFAEKLNLVSAIEVGFGGVWVGAAPELLFIPDKDQDDKPDGPPVVLLDGWGMHDTHETLNSFAWGPDGWLYGSHGVFTHSRVGKPGTPDAQREPINAGIWRYHPKKHIFEVFAHGTSNSWGFDWDEHGQLIEEACVIPHLYHMVLGGRYERQAGPHFNPYTYDDIKTIADHRHYVGDAGPHAANGKSDSAGGGHAHSGLLIYQGENWPKEYRGSIFMNNIHGARLNRDIPTPKGSGFVGGHAPDFLLANDTWSQIISLKTGPDGAVYMIDWYDKNQCHRNEDNAHDRTNGRIFKVSFGQTAPIQAEPEHASQARNVISYAFGHSKEWACRHELRRDSETVGQDFIGRNVYEAAAFDPASLDKLIDGVGDREVNPRLVAWLKTSPERLFALWKLHTTSLGLAEKDVSRGLMADDVYIRAWTIQLAMEDKKPSEATLAKFALLAKSDPSPVVRLYLASALQRMPLEKRWDILAGLVQHGEDVSDPNIPCMIWYAAEPMATLDASRAISLASGSKIPILLPFMTRRIAALGTDSALALLVDEVSKLSEPSQKLAILDGIAEALKGRRRVAMPASWPQVFAKLSRDASPQIRSRATTLGLNFGDESALASLREVLGDPAADISSRQEALAALLKARDPNLAATLRGLLKQASPLRAAALRGLAAYEDRLSPDAILGAYPNLTASEKRDALNTLASRVAFAKPLLAAVEVKKIAPAELSADLIRQLRNLKDDSLNDEIARVWGSVRETSADKAKLIAQYKGMLTAKPQTPPDLMLGRAVFAKTCQQCHTLFGVGGKVGPEITGSNRADLDYLLSNVLDPNALIGKDYTAHIVGTADGRTLTGIIRAEDKDSITLVTANETLTIPKADVEARKPSDKSMMPEDIWVPLSEIEVCSLVAYLASPAQVPALATQETAKTFFNGKDLTGWAGDPKLWSVEGGEIVGKTAGLAHNNFIRSELAAADFRLTFQVKLVKNEGNSGLQFRSEALPDGEMKGYQADIGPGWWGKLYEENGRGLLWKESGEAHLKPGEWNTYEVAAIGAKVRTSLNGKPCVDLDDPAGARRGIFAFQLHSGGATEVRFKDLRLEVDPK